MSPALLPALLGLTLVLPFPGSVRCPVCLSTEGCESATEVTCPVGHSHCYNGILKLRGGGINSKLRVQRCMSQAACNLLNETWEIGPLSVNENCDADSFWTCQQGFTLWAKPNFSKEPEEWNTFKKVTCFLEEVCQETLLLIDVGPSSLIVGNKGCGKTETQNSQILSIYSRPPGMVAVSYANFCSSNGCNNASSTSVLLNPIHHLGDTAPGDLQYPAYVDFGRSCTDSENVMCPKGATCCYKGYVSLERGGLFSLLSIPGCMAQPSLLGHINMIGPFIAGELSEDENNDLQSGAAPVPYLAQVVGLGLSLALCCRMTSMLTLFPCDS